MAHKYRTRVAGEDLLRKIKELEFQRVLDLLVLLYFLALAVLSWLLTFGIVAFNWMTSVVFTAISVVIAVRWMKKWRAINDEIKNKRKGLEGERLAAEMLDRLGNGEDTFVFHDILGNGFNVDHVVVSTKGIFTIETKHYDRSKCHEYYFDGERLYAQMHDGRQYPCPRLLPQMDGEANFIQGEIERRIGAKVGVTEVAILIGSYIRNPSKSLNKYWLVNEKSFEPLFRVQREVLDAALVKLIAAQITEWVKIDIDE